jgi:hypothetical protein
MHEKLALGRAQVVAPAALAAAAAAFLVALLTSPAGRIVGHFHVSTSVATAVVTIITGGGGWVLSTFYPWVLPFVLTIRGLIAVGGAGLAVGW